MGEVVRFQLRGEPKSGTTWAAFIVQLLFTTTCDYAGQCCVVSGSAMSRAGLLVNFSACSAAERARVAHDASLAGPGPPVACFIESHRTESILGSKAELGDCSYAQITHPGRASRTVWAVEAPGRP